MSAAERIRRDRQKPEVVWLGPEAEEDDSRRAATAFMLGVIRAGDAWLDALTGGIVQPRKPETMIIDSDGWARHPANRHERRAEAARGRRRL